MFRARVGLLVPPSPIRGRRECRAPDAPATACAEVVVEGTRVSQVTPESPGIPRAMVYGLYVISPVIGFLATVADGVASANLTPAPRRQDHTISPSASGALVRSTVRVHRIPPRVRDVRETPLRLGRDGCGYKVIWVFGKTEYFFKRDWTRD
jgi:hypothetical protein